MSTPLEFLYHFRDLLREREVRFAITSGMACVYYGLQQNTKDSDWIIEPADLSKVRDLLTEHERRVPPWRISYRPIFGAPLERDWLAAGWTSHLAIWPSAGGTEEHVDFFGTPPRLHRDEIVADEMGFVEPDAVAWMKRTDRDKDWPMVDGLGQLLNLAGDSKAVLHLQDPARLRLAWAGLEESARASAIRERPLLRLINDEPNDDTLHGLIEAERTIWETVNQERYRVFQHAWKEFYRRWKSETSWHWPTSEPYPAQHQRLLDAVRRYDLPREPLDQAGKEAAWERGLQRAVLRSGRDATMIERLAPPRSRMLP